MEAGVKILNSAVSKLLTPQPLASALLTHRCVPA